MSSDFEESWSIHTIIRTLQQISAHLMDVLKFLDATKKQCLRTFQCHTGSMNVSNFSHKSRQIISASSDYTITIWDFYSGNCSHALYTD
ncbi:hypothetical protein N7533_000358 [Penicillium manginii]|uniref:uncharacterized protein n=1 Tax=Penicillium manginii TaxID=203109 RepID=UPI0025488B0D|nr:uncharacterized protein N7533_000358 [Penicillium manginii]KAJ5767775.1 hypothetical protein N7533_000358 [Penicillium manginii]